MDLFNESRYGGDQGVVGEAGGVEPGGLDVGGLEEGVVGEDFLMGGAGGEEFEQMRRRGSASRGCRGGRRTGWGT